MRISSQSSEALNRATLTSTSISKNPVIESVGSTTANLNLDRKKVQTQQISPQEEGKEANSKEQLEKAVSSMNEFLDLQHKSSKFVLHDGLDKYYVRLVDSKTEEVIKEIPPERLLDAFYQMQKLAGMIVDEKI